METKKTPLCFLKRNREIIVYSGTTPKRKEHKKIVLHQRGMSACFANHYSIYWSWLGLENRPLAAISARKEVREKYQLCLLFIDTKNKQTNKKLFIYSLFYLPDSKNITSEFAFHGWTPFVPNLTPAFIALYSLETFGINRKRSEFYGTLKNYHYLMNFSDLHHQHHLPLSLSHFIITFWLASFPAHLIILFYLCYILLHWSSDKYLRGEPLVSHMNYWMGVTR